MNLQAKSPSNMKNQHRQNSTDHLHQFLGDGSRIVNIDNLWAAYQPSQITVDQVLRILNRVNWVRLDFIEWCRKKNIFLQHPDPIIILGLVSKEEEYNRYLKLERLEGLKGSLGLTHPVRLVSVLLTDLTALKSFDVAVVAAHEMIHQMTIISGLCPGWHAWPRWLHEGMAMMGDHTAAWNTSKSPTSQSITEGPGFGSLNARRSKVWQKNAMGFEMKSFIRRDLLANPLSHSDDYAACWALTYGLAHWKKGRVLTELIDFLKLQELQPESQSTIETVTAEWLIQSLGDDWHDFIMSLQKIGT